MNKFIITVLTKDRPGIIAHVTRVLFELGCNLENVNQMILQDQFAGLFLVEAPAALDKDHLNKTLTEQSRDLGLVIHVNTLEKTHGTSMDTEGDIFLITTIGPDQKGLVAGFSAILAAHGANIVNLKAVFKGGPDPRNNVMSYQVWVTPDMDTAALFADLRKRADELGLDIRIQHKNIFDAINKI
ncbi:MAG: ACT domain-containing protein [Desulfotignum sp.]|nr:ACT domain-containing protein [Desulfotignum sp.]